MASGCVRILGYFSLLLFVLVVCLSASATNLENELRLDRYERQAIETPSTPLPPKTASAGENLKTAKPPLVTPVVTSADGAYGISPGTAATNVRLGITTQVPSVKNTATTAEGNQGIAAVPQPPPCQPVTNPGLGTNFNLSFVPSVLYIHEGEVQNVTIVYSGLISPHAMLIKSSDEAMFVVISNDTFFMEPIGNNDNVTLTVTLRGTHVGVTYLHLILDPIRYDTDDAEVFTYLVKTKRIPRFIDTLFDNMLLPLVLIVTCGMGCKLDLDVLKIKLRRPIPILVGPVCQFICMPLVALCISKVLKFDPLTAIGLLTVGSCPGGGLSNMITLLVDADLIMSITMTFASTCLALGMLPLNLFIYGRFFTPEDAEEAGINLPIGKIILQIFFITVPLLFGMLIRYKLPKVAYYVVKSLNVLSVILIVLTLGVGVYSNVYIIYSPGLVMLGGFLHPTLGFIIGFVMARLIARFPIDSSCTVSIETGVQNNLIAISLIKLSFDQPEADIMARMPIIVAISAVSIGVGMVFASIPINRRRTRNEKRAKEMKNVSEKSDYQPVELVEKTDSEAPTSNDDASVPSHDIVVLERGMTDGPESVV